MTKENDIVDSFEKNPGVFRTWIDRYSGNYRILHSKNYHELIRLVNYVNTHANMKPIGGVSMDEYGNITQAVYRSD